MSPPCVLNLDRGLWPLSVAVCMGSCLTLVRERIVYELLASICIIDLHVLDRALWWGSLGRSALLIYTCSTARSGGSVCRPRSRECAFACQGYLDRSALLIYTRSSPHCDVLSASEDVSLRVGIVGMWVHLLGLIPNRQG